MGKTVDKDGFCTKCGYWQHQCECQQKFEVDEFPDGSLCLSFGNSMEEDLVFASGAMRGDSVLEKQRAIIQYIVDALNAYSAT